jgi:modulator of FtsH protease
MTPADWQGFAEMTGGASGALTGLLFVAVSLNASRIAGHQGLRASAAQTLVLFIAPLVMSAALLAPGQPDWVLGAELIVTGLVTSWILLGLRRVKHTLNDDDQLLVAIFNRRAVNVVVMLLFTASGALLASDESAGLYLLLPVTVISFISGVLNAWYFLLPPLRPATPPKTHPRPTGPTDPAGHARRTDHSDPTRHADPASHTEGG